MSSTPEARAAEDKVLERWDETNETFRDIAIDLQMRLTRAEADRDEARKRVEVLSRFARTAPGRLPSKVEAALTEEKP